MLLLPPCAVTRALPAAADDGGAALVEADEVAAAPAVPEPLAVAEAKGEVALDTVAAGALDAVEEFAAMADEAGVIEAAAPAAVEAVDPFAVALVDVEVPAAVGALPAIGA